MKKTMMLSFSLGMAVMGCICSDVGANVPYARPMPSDRTFNSPILEQKLRMLASKNWKNGNLKTLFENCLPMTLDSTVGHFSKGQIGVAREDTYLLVGNINTSIVGMWIRDSAQQVEPYVRFAKQEPDVLGALLRGVINRHVDSILLDPYAMAFSLVHPNGESDQHSGDNTTCLSPTTGERLNAMDRKMGVRERKFEMDSLLWPLRFARLYHNETGDEKPFDAKWVQAVATIFQTLRDMQQPLNARNYTKAPYTFQRSTAEPKDTLAHGVGKPMRYTGMVRGAFRPSDNAQNYPYHVPDNCMAVVELRGVAKLLTGLSTTLPLARDDPKMTATMLRLVTEAQDLANDIDAGIKTHGAVRHPNGDTVLALEVDGFGNAFFADDANVPSLLSLPFLGYMDKDDALYKATRAYVLKADTNPYFYGPGTANISGVGSDNVANSVGWGHVMPLGLMMQAYTSDDDEEIAKMLAELSRTSINGFMHESVFIDDLTEITNPSFAWANSFFGDLILHINVTNPSLLFH